MLLHINHQLNLTKIPRTTSLCSFPLLSSSNSCFLPQGQLLTIWRTTVAQLACHYTILYRWGSDTHLTPQGQPYHLFLGPHHCHGIHLSSQLSFYIFTAKHAWRNMTCCGFGQPRKPVLKQGTKPQLQVSSNGMSVFLFTT